jgi:hypothetical protein
MERKRPPSILGHQKRQGDFRNYRPPAYGTTADVEDRFVHYMVLAVGQENHDRCSMVRVSV